MSASGHKRTQQYSANPKPLNIPARQLNPPDYIGSDTTWNCGMVHIRVLTALKIKQNLKPGMYADGLGLYLRVGSSNSKHWILRYRTKGKLRDMYLGPLHTVSLAEARDKAEVCRVMRLKGLDPLEERSKEQQARTIEAAVTITFEKCAEIEGNDLLSRRVMLNAAKDCARCGGTALPI